MRLQLFWRIWKQTILSLNRCLPTHSIAAMRMFNMHKGTALSWSDRRRRDQRNPAIPTS